MADKRGHLHSTAMTIKMLLAGAVALSTISAANAAERVKLPREMLGTWCESLRMEKSQYVAQSYTVYDKLDSCKPNVPTGEWITVSANRFNTYGGECRFVNVAASKDGYTVRARCTQMEGPPQPSFLTFVMSLQQNGPTRSTDHRWTSLIIQDNKASE